MAQLYQAITEITELMMHYHMGLASGASGW